MGGDAFRDCEVAKTVFEGDESGGWWMRRNMVGGVRWPEHIGRSVLARYIRQRALHSLIIRISTATRPLIKIFLLNVLLDVLCCQLPEKEDDDRDKFHERYGRSRSDME